MTPTHRHEWKALVCLIGLLTLVVGAPLIVYFTQEQGSLISALAPALVWIGLLLFYGYPMLLKGVLFFTGSQVSSPHSQADIQAFLLTIGKAHGLEGPTTFALFPASLPGALLQPSAMLQAYNADGSHTIPAASVAGQAAAFFFSYGSSTWKMSFTFTLPEVDIPRVSAHEQLAALSALQTHIVPQAHSFPVRLAQYLPKGILSFKRPS